ncbi:GGDEF domain-containing protein [Kibdelosporangium aridum]|uniref:Diguanylate cyclase (GGDEF) domain-containing protein n=1 Tax=Kibdelosporangium aridum TaxID=2030 RepID=A0A1W2D0U4_KIBAR|nr:GGDEF domain-containing protein [Kibdelosporangium aridum]SMC90756.1 diguanylate cyclase (GGDEF) domain-containing protein [Kibdelosporangium aridum]
MADQIGRLGVRRWGRIGYVLGIDLLAVAGVVVALSLIPIPSANLLPFVLLASCALLYTELSVRTAGRAFFDLNSVWMFAAILLLHPVLSALVITVSYFAQWVRVRPDELCDRTFRAAATIVAGYAASAFFAMVTDTTFEHMPRDIASFALVVGAGLVFLIFKWAAIQVADRTAVSADYAVEASAIALGIVLAWALVDWPIVLLLIIGITLVMHRTVLIRQLRDQARADPKTGLLNSAAWSNDATAWLARGESAALLMLDLDNFKSINDRYGHLVGDKHLKGVAEVLKSEVRATDMVGRFGGEEFVILLPGTTQDDAMAIAERIRRRVEGFAVEGLGTVTVSVGVAAHPDHGTTLEEVMNAADLALLAAKTAGRNRTLLFAAPPA